MRPLIITLLIVLYAALSGRAADSASERLGVRDGLSNNSVTDITADSYGFLWIATDNGLNRFDGERFITFSEKDGTLKGNSVNALYFDKATGYLWVGTKKGIDIIDTRTLRSVGLPVPPEIGERSVADFAPDGDKGIYILPNYGFIGYYDKNTDSCRVYREADFDGLIMSMYCAATAGDGRLVAGQENYGLSFIDLNDRKVENYMHNQGDAGSLAGNNVRAVLVSRKGDIYAGTDHGVSRFDSASRTFEPLPLNDPYGNSTGQGSIVSLLELADGTVLASCSDVMFQDSFGNIWTGTAGNGLRFIPANPPVFDKAGDRSGYAGPYIVHKDGVPPAVLPYLSNRNAHIAAMAESGDELLVSIAGEGIFNVDTRSGKASRIATQYEKDYANTIYVLDDGTALLGTQHGLYEYRGGRLLRNETISAATGYLVPNGILTDSRGNLWVGTYGNGVFVFDSAGKSIAHLTTGNGLASNAVKQMLADSRRWLWVAGQDGLSVIKDMEHPENIENFSYDSGLGDISIRSLVEDADGNIWVASNNVLCRYNAATDSIEAFGDRLKVTESTFSDRAAGRTDDGTLYFGTLDGIYSFHPENFGRQTSASPLRIVGYGVQGDETIHYNPGPAVELPYGHHTVRIFFANPDFSKHGKESYYYRLEGAGDDWIRMPDSHEIVLGDLSPGEYVLTVRSDINGAEAAGDLARLELSVRRPWWLMWWAVAIYVLLGAGIVLLIIRYGRNRRRMATAPAAMHKQDTSDGMSAVDKEFLERFTSLVERNMGRPDLDMEFLQAELGMSHSTLYRRLKNLTGMSGNEFIKKCRLRKGFEMLQQGFGVSETAYACGFSDPGYFRTCFKNEYGMAPSEMRKK